jgi:hypothetical protein
MKTPIAQRTLAIVQQDRREARRAFWADIMQRLDELAALIRAHRDSSREGRQA